MSGLRKPYNDPDRRTWQAIGYRHGMQNRTENETAMDAAWEWSKVERKRQGTEEGTVDVTKFKPAGH